MGAITRGIANNILGSGAIDGTDALTGTIPATNIANASLDNLTTFPPSVDAGIPQVAGDPPSPSDGDVWYNTNTYKLRVRGLGAGSWASGGNLNTARGQTGAVGTQTAGLAFGGEPPPSGLGATESYNGSAWTEVNDLNTARRLSRGTGDQTAALSIGGYITNIVANVESWNGTGWTAGTNVNTARYAFGQSGTQTDALAISGQALPGVTTNTEVWNGSSWTEVNDVNTGRQTSGTGSNSTDAIIMGGNYTPGRVGNTETWNGTSWTEVNDLNSGRDAAASFSSAPTALIAGGNTGPAKVSVTESWDGTSWTEVADLPAIVEWNSGAGGFDAGLSIGGTAPATTAATNEWTRSPANLNVDLA